MLERYIPDAYQKSIYTINYNKLKDNGIKCLLFDLDNTCVGYHEKNPTVELKKLFKKLKKLDFTVIIFSNAPKKRLVPFQELGVVCHHSSMKPFTYHFKKVMKRYHFKKGEVCIIGDQLFTDIYGGNKVGIKTCLVEPLTDIDFFLTKFTRRLEAREFRKMEKEKLLKKGNYYD